jgi:large subunit ribosomal protein L47
LLEVTPADLRIPLKTWLSFAQAINSSFIDYHIPECIGPAVLLLLLLYYLKYSAMAFSLAVPSCTRCTSIPLFLAPAFVDSSFQQLSSRRTFSTTHSTASRRTTGPNKQRGVSAIRSKPPKQKTEAYKYELPTPALDPKPRELFKMNKDHGLYAFFDQKRRPMVPPVEESQHGRAWSYKELEIKSFEDLHKLYWACVLEANRVSTRFKEMSRTASGFGQAETDNRLETVR